MLLAIDIGNTNVAFGVYDGDNLLFISRINTDKRLMSDQYAVTFKDILSLHGVEVTSITGAVIASVVASVGSAVKAAVKTLFGISPVVLGPGVKTGINILIDNPAQMGADMVAAAVSAIKKYPVPAVVIDFGTATTFSAIDKDKNMIGASIAAGVRLTLSALATNADQLYSISIEPPGSVIGKNTEDSVRSGLMYGTAAMVDGMIDGFKKELGQSITVIATGGLAHLIVPLCKSRIVADDNIILEGLKIIYDKNRK